MTADAAAAGKVAPDADLRDRVAEAMAGFARVSE